MVQRITLALVVVIAVLNGDDRLSTSAWQRVETIDGAENSKVIFAKDHPHQKALAALFSLGLPDPKGLPYHRLILQMGGHDGTQVNVETEGWLLPGADSTPIRFAITWNGLIYPVEELGEVLKLTPRPSIDDGPGGMRQAHGEAAEVLPHHRTFVRYAYLSRLGFKEEADQIANHKSFQRHEDLFKAAVNEWAWSSCFRAIEAFRHVNDQKALASISQFMAIQAKRPERGTDKPANRADPLTQLTYQAKHLETEIKRRLAQDSENEAAFLASDPSMEALIDRLDEIKFIRYHQESVNPVIDAIISKGDEAIDPLIQCLESDQRLTRHVTVWKHWAPHRHIFTVRQAAHYTLGRLLEDSTMQQSRIAAHRDFEDDAYFADLANKVRTQWKKYGPVTEIDRNLSILKDDAASPAQWADAAEALVDPACLEGDLLFAEAAVLPNPGRALDESKQASVAPLITARIDELVGVEGDQHLRNAHPLKSLFLSLWIWDREEGEKALQKLIPADGQPFTDAMASDDALEYLLFRLENRSAAALRVLECSMRSKAPDDYMVDLADHYPLRVIFRNASSPPYLEIFSKLQNDPESPWNYSKTGRQSLQILVTSGVRAKGMNHQFFRDALLATLQDRSPDFATLKRLRDEPDLVVYQGNEGTRMRISTPSDIGIEPGESMGLSRADIAADAMAGELQPRVAFEIYWPQDKRGKVIDELVLLILKKQPQ